MEPAGRLGRIGGVVDGANHRERAGAGLNNGGSVVLVDPAHRHEWPVDHASHAAHQRGAHGGTALLGWCCVDRPDGNIVGALVDRELCLGKAVRRTAEQPSLEAWRPKSLTGDISDVTCQDVLTRGLLASGAASEQSARQLDCNAVWADYLVVAIRVFRDHAADSVRDGNLGGCDAASDKLSDGR